MPTNLFQKSIFALLTVVVTVHAYVFFSLYVVNGGALMQAAGTDRVPDAVNALGGVYAFGTYLPIWAIVLIEFVFAFTLEMTMGSPCSFRLACKVFSPKTTHPVLFETAIICTTVALMCPAMSLIAAFLYYRTGWGSTFSPSLRTGSNSCVITFRLHSLRNCFSFSRSFGRGSNLSSVKRKTRDKTVNLPHKKPPSTEGGLLL